MTPQERKDNLDARMEHLNERCTTLTGCDNNEDYREHTRAILHQADECSTIAELDAMEHLLNAAQALMDACK